ncbi:helix-turn-helix domain-containing protein [Streptomyces sp. NPDC002838]|uniref:PucR family transcriptional regulator n=1 Tax=Streptomyces sp. NPDC002838 TaxID=3154436 RepID=UPI00331E258A
MTGHIISSVPEPGVGPAPFATLHRDAEALVLTSLCALVGDDRAPQGGPRDGVDTVRDCVRRGIPLERVLRGIRLGHAFLHRALRDAAPDGQLPATAVEALFEQADRLSGQLAEAYVAERARWESSEESARRRMVEAVVSGEQSDPGAAEHTLDYAVDRHHVALILWRESPPDTGPGPDPPVAELLAASGGQSLLQMAGHATDVWLWIGLSARPHRLLWPPSLPDGWRAVAGPPSFGLAGLRRSHLSARHAARIAAAMPTAPGVCEYTRIRTACLLTADAEQARWYLRETLGPLAAPDPWSHRLRETLRCYLATGRSLKTTAQQLGVARNTVAYRVKRAEELLGSTGSMATLETQLALEILRFPGASEVGSADRPREADRDPGPMRQMYVKAGLVP